MAKHAAVVIGTNYDTATAASSDDVRGSALPLRYAEADALAMITELTTAGYDVTPLVGRDATREAILSAILAGVEAVAPDGLLLVHFSGHGGLSGGRGYLLPDDYSTARLEVSSILMGDVVPLYLMKAPTAVLLLDCCYSGITFGTRGADDDAANMRSYSEQVQAAFVGTTARGYAVVTACEGDRHAYERPALQHGAFTYYVLDHWRHHSGQVTIDSLYSSVENGLQTSGLPTPLRGGVHRSIVLRPAVAPLVDTTGSTLNVAATLTVIEDAPVPSDADATVEVRTSVQIFPDHAERTARIVAQRAAEFEGAQGRRDLHKMLRVGEQILILDPNHPTRQAIINTYVHFGQDYLRRTAFHEAIPYYTRAIELDPEEPNYHFQRGQAHMGALDFAMAEADFTRALDITEHPNFYFWRGKARREREDVAGAIADFYKACQLDEDNGEYYYMLGQAYEADAQAHEALECYRLAFGARYPSAKEHVDRLLSVINRP